MIDLVMDFFNSNFFQTLATLLAGLVAFEIYSKQKRDRKKDAANSILLEIQHAEKSIERVRESVREERLEIDITILQSNSWEKNNHLFVRDFDRDEWNAISNFYKKSQLLDETIRYNNTAFANEVEQIRINRQRILADFAKDLLDQASADTETDINAQEMLSNFNEKVSTFDNLYMSKQELPYKPMKPIDDAKTYLEDLSTLTTSSVGTKLKNIAKAE